MEDAEEKIYKKTDLSLLLIAILIKYITKLVSYLFILNYI